MDAFRIGDLNLCMSLASWGLFALLVLAFVLAIWASVTGQDYSPGFF